MANINTKYRYLTLEQRRVIESLHNAGVRTVEIAEVLGSSPPVIYAELKRGYTGERNEQMLFVYSAELAQRVFMDGLARRGRRRRGG